MTPNSDADFAAGAVCWRLVDGVTQIVVVRRPRYDDLSLPKGKVDPGETLPQTAVREVAEETGLDVALGVPLGATHYRIAGGREKYVQYWAAQVTDAALGAQRFTPNDEIGALEWLTLAQARTRLSYAHDVDVVDEFERLHGEQAQPSFGVIVLRHAKALSRGDWSGADAKRPLVARGVAQAERIAPAIMAWRPRRILTSPAVRCVATVTPLSRLSGRKLRLEPGISQDAWDDGDGAIREIVAKRVSAAKTAVLCSHRPVLPDILRELADAAGTVMGDYIRDAAALETAAFSIVHLSAGRPESRILAIETHIPPV